MSVLSKIQKLLSRRNNGAYIRYLRSKGVSIGENTQFISPTQSDVDVGRAHFISIGNNCVISAGVSIIAHDYSWKNLVLFSNDIFPSGGKPVQIGNNVFIGARSIILGGVSIGNNSIIAAGSVVCKPVPENSVYGGNPARQIMTLEEYREKRQLTYVEDAKNNARYIYKNKGVRPTVEEMKNFVVLFAHRQKDELDAFFSDKTVTGMDKSVYIELINRTKPLYDSFDAFLDDALREI